MTGLLGPPPDLYAADTWANTTAGGVDQVDDDEASYGPYHTAAPTYHKAGWHPFPIVGKAISIPKGFTGADGRPIAYTDVVGWMMDRPDDNVALRLIGVIGIDVDAYTKDGKVKRGDQTLALAEAAWGPLPPTWRSTSRGAGNPSGIRFYRIPDGVELETIVKLPDPDTGELYGDIEIIQRHHRYAVAWPSIHPDTGAQYRWYRPDDVEHQGPPNVTDLAWLTPGWQTGLASKATPIPTRAPVVATAQEAQPDAWHDKVTDHYRNGLDAVGGTAGSRHDNTHRAVGQLARDESLGRAGATTALTMLRDRFVAAIGNDTRQRDPGREFDGMVDWWRLKVATTVSTLEADRALVSSTLTTTTRPAVAAPVMAAPTRQAPPDPDPTDEPDEVELPLDFWDTPELAHIYTEARAAMCNPITTLTVCLARVGTILSPRWRTGRAKGINPGSLAVFTALIGPPGAGKTRHAEVPRALIPHPLDEMGATARWFKDRARPGSAAGLAAMYAIPDDDEKPPVTSVWCEYDEGSQLLAVSTRVGEPIIAELCSAWAGQDLSTQLRDKNNTRHVPAGTYGLGMAVNLQTEPAARLLASDGIGLPQRFLWCSAVAAGEWDPDAWDTDVRPVRPVEWTEPTRTPPPLGASYSAFELPPTARRDLYALTNPDRDPLDDPLDVHHPYLRNKLACAIAGLHGRSQVNDDDWLRAGTLVGASAGVRRSVRDEVAIRAASDREYKRQADARDAVAADRAVDADRRARDDEWATAAQSKMLAALDNAGCDGLTRSALTRGFYSAKRQAAADLLDALIDDGVVVDRGNGRVTR